MISLREIAARTGIKKTSVHKIVKEHGFHPYKGICVPPLSAAAKQKRLAFCNEMRLRLEQEHQFHRRLIFTDETSVGQPTLNHQNYRKYSRSQPYEYVETYRIRQKATLWSGCNYYLGVLPCYWINGTMDTLEYCDLIQNRVWPDLVDRAGQEALENYYYFLQDGAPAHTAMVSIAVLYNKFNHVVSAKADIEWPPYSPDLNVCDYYLWARGKEKHLSSRNIVDHMVEFENRHSAIPLDEVQRAINDFPKRIMLCLGADGGHFDI